MNREGIPVRVCGSCHFPSLRKILDMGEQPLAERCVPEAASYPLCLVQCEQCGLVQLNYHAPQSEMFPRDHPYATGNSGLLRRHFAELAAEVQLNVLDGEVVVDIGANDGTFLRELSLLRPDIACVAVEPTDQVLKLARLPVYARQGFFTADMARSIREEFGPARVIVATNVLAHVPLPHDFLSGVLFLLDKGGRFITENHHLASITDGLQIDTIYHEHLRYYTPATLGWLLRAHNLDIRSVRPVDTHGGSFRTVAVRASSDVANRALAAASELRRLLAGLKGPVFGVSAATRATPLLHFARIAPFIDRVCEVSSSEKIGKFMPGTTIPIVDEGELLTQQPPYALLFAWHMAEFIVPKLRAGGYEGKFIVPLPWPEVTDGEEFCG